MKPIITMNEQTALLTAVKETGFQFHKNKGGIHAYDIYSPFCFLDGDSICFYLIFSEDGKFMLTDAGNCLFHLLSMSHRVWSYRKVDAWFRDFFVSEGIYLNDGELRIGGEISALGQAFLDMTRAFLVLEMKFIETGWISR